jgi:hypothetical protein
VEFDSSPRKKEAGAQNDKLLIDKRHPSSFRLKSFQNSIILMAIVLSGAIDNLFIFL